MPVSLEPVAVLLVTRPRPQCEGKMPYSPLSLVVVVRTCQLSAQKMKAPSPLKPLTVKPVRPMPLMRCVASVRQPGPMAAVVLHLEGEAGVAGPVGVGRRREVELAAGDVGDAHELAGGDGHAIVGQGTGPRQSADLDVEQGIGGAVA